MNGDTQRIEQNSNHGLADDEVTNSDSIETPSYSSISTATTDDQSSPSISARSHSETPESQSESDKSQKDMFSPVHQTDPATTVVDIASTIWNNFYR